jgi:hypothetical protein
MEITKRTVVEAIKYIQDSIKEWEATDQDHKIISLSNWAEKWHSGTNSVHISRMIALQKNMRELKYIIHRNDRTTNTTDDDTFENAWDAAKKEYDELVAKYGEPKPKIKKKTTKSLKEEKRD